MDSLFRIWSVGLYEFKNLLRSKVFRIFVVFALLFLVLVHLISGINHSWNRHGIPSMIPYATFVFLNTLQAVIAVYMSSGFFSREKLASSTDSLYARFFTNVEYLFGKLTGVVIVFLIVNTLIFTFTFVSHAVLIDSPIVLRTYLYYFLLLPVPTVIYVSGLTFLLMAVIRHRPLVCLIMTAYVILTSFQFDLYYYYLFDVMGTHLPMLYSGFVGFGRVFPMLYQRLMYATAGFACFALSVPLFNSFRLLQSRVQNGVSLILGVLLMACSVFMGHLFLKGAIEGIDNRESLTEVNRQYAEYPAVRVSQYNLSVIHDGKEIGATATMQFENTTDLPIDTCVFSLNPGLTIDSITHKGTAATYERHLSIIEIELPDTLDPGENDSLKISYRGSIDEEACYINSDETIRSKNHFHQMIAIDKRYAFIEPDYLLLTGEALWYPIAGVMKSPENSGAGTGYCRFTLDVATRPDLTAVSQGKSVKTGDGQFSFTPEYPLPCISLAIGDYVKKSVEVEGIEYAIYHKRGHDFFSQYFTAITDKLPELILDEKNEFEFTLGLTYPFKRFSLVEVPIQFLALQREWTLSTETVQPEQILMPEKGVLMWYINFKKRKAFLEDPSRSRITTPVESETIIFRSFVNASFLRVTAAFKRQLKQYAMKQMSESKRKSERDYSNVFVYNYNILPMYTGHVFKIHSDSTPILDRAVELYIKSKLNHSFGESSRAFKEDITFDTPYDIARKALSTLSLRETGNNPDYSDIMYDILQTKSELLFLGLGSRIGVDNFDRFLNEFITKNKFRTVSSDDFIHAVEVKFDYDLKPDIMQWLDQKGLAAFTFSNVTCCEFLDGNRKRFQVMLTVRNMGVADGVVRVSLHPLGRNTKDDLTTRCIYLEADTTKEIGILFDEQPHEAVFLDALLSDNIPKLVVEHFAFLGEVDDVVPFDGDRVIDNPVEIIQPGTVIVDNTDPGFRILSDSNDSIFRWGSKSADAEEGVTSRPDFLKAPKQWREALDHHFYSLEGLKRSGCYIRSGSGDRSVSWTAELPESGDYDIYFYIPDFSQQLKFLSTRPGSWKKIIFDDFYFQIKNGGVVERIKLRTKDPYHGWKLLGTWPLSSGSVEVILTNESNGEVVFADAVKWVKR